jgi:hypothetical protein
MVLLLCVGLVDPHLFPEYVSFKLVMIVVWTAVSILVLVV